MVAETVTSTRASEAFPAYVGKGNGDCCVAWGTYSITENSEPGDVYEMCRVPKDAVVVGGFYFGANGVFKPIAPTITDGTISPTEFETKISITADATAAEFGIGQLTVIVFYTMR